VYDSLILAVELFVSLPVFAYSAYSFVLLVGSLAYAPQPRAQRTEVPKVSVLLAVYNEANVVGQTLDALASLAYPPERLQLVVADDSTDDTTRVVDEKSAGLRARGVDVVVSRRADRSGFKAGALNKAFKEVNGELVLLVDADSRVTTDALTQGIETLGAGGLSFVSFRVGHYNRDANLVTRAFALFQDTIDGLQKMGSTRLVLPYSLQGGFVLARAQALRDAGLWREGVLAEDADLSCRLFAAGLKGAYLSGAELKSEDPSSLRVWKRQAARVAHGWAQCLRLDFRGIITSRHLGVFGKAGLLLTLLSPFASLTWIFVTLLSGVAITSGVLAPAGSVFSNPLYLGAVSLPVVIFYVAGVSALRVRRMLNWRDLAVLPILSYMVSGMFTISAISFARGLAGRKAEFFRTPKRGPADVSPADGQPGEGKGVRLTEALLSLFAVGLSVPIFLLGQYFLGLSLVGFGLVTLKSMELTSGLGSRRSEGAV
jgi:cellulose synthase/poly-beta-1,6-N-acetylglucosamine synthase-like glycosyltransferase